MKCMFDKTRDCNDECVGYNIISCDRLIGNNLNDISNAINHVADSINRSGIDSDDIEKLSDSIKYIFHEMDITNLVDAIQDIANNIKENKKIGSKYYDN